MINGRANTIILSDTDSSGEPVETVEHDITTPHSLIAALFVRLGKAFFPPTRSQHHQAVTEGRDYPELIDRQRLLAQHTTDWNQTRARWLVSGIKQPV